EIPHGLEPGAEAVLEGLDGLAEIARATVALHQLGLVIEQVDVARRASHEKMDHALRLRVEFPSGQAFLRQRAFAPEHAGQGEAAEAAAGLPEEFAARRQDARRRAMEYVFCLAFHGCSQSITHRPLGFETTCIFNTYLLYPGL